MNEKLKQVMQRNYDGLTTHEGVINAIEEISRLYPPKASVAEDILKRLNDAPDNIDYAKQQLNYLVRCVENEYHKDLVNN